jgi:hypothetical protein
VGIGTTPNASSIFQAKAATNSHVAIWDYLATPMILGLTDAGASQSLRIAGFPLTFTGNGGAGSEHARITSDGKLGLGTSSPGTTNGGLDIASGGLGLIIGADGSLSSRTNATNKQARIGAYHYTNAEEPVGIATVFSTASSNAIFFGGGTSDLNAATALEFYTAANTTTTTGTQRMVINSLGRVGIGTASPSVALDVVGQVKASVLFNVNGEGFIRGDTAGQLQIQAGTSGVMFRNNANNTEHARIDSSGRLLVGTSTDSALGGWQSKVQVASTGFDASISLRRDTNTTSGPVLAFGKSRGSLNGVTVVSDSDQLGSIFFYGADGTDVETAAASIACQVDGTPGANDMPGRLVFSTTADGASSPTERMRITNDGQVWIANTTGSLSSTGIILGYAGDLYCGISTGNTLHVYSSSAGAYRFYVNENGGISNYSGNNVNLSDEREKKNIETLDSTWDCLKDWELKKFHYNEDADTDDKRYGVIAQQVAPHCPEVISQWIKQPAQDAVLDDDGNVVTPATEEVTRMGVKEQQMMWMAIKALQEAQTRIETLEAEVAALKAQWAYSLTGIAG